jgi:hypothetical protein
MQIQTATKEELGLLIHGLRSFIITNQVQLQKRLLAQLELELTTRYGLKVREPA